MSIALERSNSGNMTCVSSIYSSIDYSAADRIISPAEAVEEVRSGSFSSSSTSSIGKNSDDSSGRGDGGGEEVQSEFKGGALDCLDALEEVLPVKRGISQFYRGKSKSFTNLSDAASCSAIQDITKPEDIYTRKRKNLMAYNNLWGKKDNISRSSNRIPKRPTSSRSMLSLAETVNCNETSVANCRLRPPLPPQARRNIIQSELSSIPPAGKFYPCRSFSLSDLQGAAAEE